MRSLPLLAFLAATATAQPTPPSLQNLIANSPFGSANQASGAPTANTPLEFRGTFVDNGERFFSILDTASRRAEWVSLNESGRPFLVKNYDPEKESITLEFQGRAMDLKLHSARVTAMPMPQPAMVNNSGAPQVGGGGAQVRPGPQPTTTEAQRLAQVAEEIRRRRALRQQAQQGNQPVSPIPVPPQPPSNSPQPR
ncbi:MAG: hypothetical protein C0518_11415 [Opitutus sp.]|nr:hypothetical protein [Opitutus sp.]